MTYQQLKDDSLENTAVDSYPETLMTAVLELEQTYRTAIEDPEFQTEFEELLVRKHVGRENPSTLPNAHRLLGGAKIHLKREDSNHNEFIKLTMFRAGIACETDGKRKKIAIAENWRGAAVCKQLPQQPSLIWNVPFIWGKKMLNVRLSTFSYGIIRCKGSYRNGWVTRAKRCVKMQNFFYLLLVEDTHYVMDLS